jgi:hypothetical protein
LWCLLRTPGPGRWVYWQSWSLTKSQQLNCFKVPRADQHNLRDIRQKAGTGFWETTEFSRTEMMEFEWVRRWFMRWPKNKFFS